MAKDLTKEELALRLYNCCTKMDVKYPDWDTALFVSKINQYYFTGTMQDALLAVRRGGGLYYFVRRSLERARDESPLETIYPMNSYRDAAGVLGADLGKTYVETEIMPLAVLDRLKKYFTMAALGSLDKTVLAVRAVKTPYELAAMEESGRIHDDLMRNIVPTLLREGMSETDLCTALLEKMLERGFHGVTRFQMFQTDLGIGQIGFGVSSLYPTYFDGPGGHVGLSPVAPIMGSRERKLKRGDAVFIDIGFGIRGYNSDKSQAYIFGAKPTEEMVLAQRACLDIEKRTASLLMPGARPSEIYRTVMDALSPDFKRDFMGFGGRQVKFLGHGIGLHVDELPVIAEGFDEPIEENMAFAIEPKKGIRDVGLVGVEDTYVVEKTGARCITGSGCDIIEVR
ncbi:Xaa-Pro aminopeptidase [Sporobacter termitidis DSM 10068]|uniref:Xaa-Pro aminopeptidase n=1 Tax=Sporobacter termitidis DSM 10068 TaxID=1123282 RepID=A0A1M5ZHA3_9FIRM|nr:M24 family metallopeptidase [Sporobacter termitidis]SHI23551.1 Xaa-Pro aminopeptidase [Sporobacter termitidis DSM 10068]